ncbi:hypothetical protein A2767_06980 [Candidatus Roizmanbacteria bacterium RIFCSPHIGHO2_01_FULL_35_10]|uniref:Large ribosomal subunit protein bL25 n=1 Tax=Candidatus Roizmanbacteria bacterium RIFCSPLOWO2_01_FULL_35_13 TaxID=1802055 RepID=A0A1F7I877_9BACT|nr:MAG: hypothetical protein A2767_06980 [Candidatus Roizmanbacteria bacterium RIFCSPHIGHO2_01_FULL_35_10]OGK39570.1 MAG: hypothetical protein A3A74_06620 [Candidatus Roizmanbacteria bacterium RIFCSPLOWO2_01_FULL_35_13]
MANTKKSKSDQQTKLTLIVTPRTVFGKKLNKLRKEGNIPANIYGQDFKSQSVTAVFKDFTKTYKIAKETGVVFLDLDKKELPVLIKNVQRHPVNDNILHIDFRKIDLKQKIQTEVPIKVIGQSEAVSVKAGVLLTQAESLLVEALPTDIPQQIEIDITSLKEIGQEYKVSNLPKSDKFEVKDDQNKVIVSIVQHKEEEILPQTAPAVAPEVITAKPDEEGTAIETKTAEPAGKATEAKTPSASTGKKEEKPAK